MEKRVYILNTLFLSMEHPFNILERHLKDFLFSSYLLSLIFLLLKYHFKQAGVIKMGLRVEMCTRTGS